MVFLKGRFAAGLLIGLLALPTAALAQCGHSNPGQTGTPRMAFGQGGQMGGMTSQMSSLCSLRMQTPPTSLMQSGQMQWFGLQQGQQLHLQQMQMIAMQQQWLAQRQPPLPPLDGQAPQPKLGQAQQKQFGPLLQKMEALEQRLTGLEKAAQRNELQPPQAGAVQNDVNALQLQVDALSKAPAALLDRMSSLHRRTDELLDAITAKPANLITAVRNSR